MDPGVGIPCGDVELDRMVCERGISSGAGLLPLLETSELGGDDAVCGSDDGFEERGGEPSDPGGRELLPLVRTLAPSGSVTLICAGSSVCAPLARGLEPGRWGAVARERLFVGVDSVVSVDSGGEDDSVSLSLSLPLFLCFLDCCWPMGRACNEDEGEPG